MNQNIPSLQGFHAAPAYLNAANNARLRAVVAERGGQAEQFGITAYSHPVRATANQV